MKPLFFLLFVLVMGVEAQTRQRYCTQSSDCDVTESCVRQPISRYSFWPWFKPGVCQPMEPLVKTCSSGADCGKDECCESTAQLRGRKKRQAGVNGVCKPLQDSGRSCLIQYPSGKPASIVLQCPCTAQLTCIPDGGHIVPQGDTGVCGISEPKTKPCTSGSDCGRDECCESTAQVKGRKKRQIGGAAGVCKPLQKSEGSCLTQYGPGKPFSTVLKCPCEMGLRCEADGNNAPPLGFTGVCRAPVPCETGADCGPGECCKSRVRPIGRRKRQTTGGTCEPLAAVGDTCFTRYSPGKPTSMVYSCPCEQGLQCRGSGIFDVPLGETGTCIGAN